MIISSSQISKTRQSSLRRVGLISTTLSHSKLNRLTLVKRGRTIDIPLVILGRSRFTKEKIQQGYRASRMRHPKVNWNAFNFQTNLFRKLNWGSRKSIANFITNRNGKLPIFRQKSVLWMSKTPNWFKNTNETKLTTIRVSKRSQVKMSVCDMRSIFLLRTLRIWPINLISRLRALFWSNRSTIKPTKNWFKSLQITKD